MEPMLPSPPPSDPLWALTVATIYFGTFLVIGFGARLLLDRLMGRSGVRLEDVHGLAGPNRPKREVFLLGVWRTEE